MSYEKSYTKGGKEKERTQQIMRDKSKTAHPHLNITISKITVKNT